MVHVSHQLFRCKSVSRNLVRYEDMHLCATCTQIIANKTWTHGKQRASIATPAPSSPSDMIAVLDTTKITKRNYKTIKYEKKQRHKTVRKKNLQGHLNLFY